MFVVIGIVLITIVIILVLLLVKRRRTAKDTEAGLTRGKKDVHVNPLYDKGGPQNGPTSSPSGVTQPEMAEYTAPASIHSGATSTSTVLSSANSSSPSPQQVMYELPQENPESRPLYSSDLPFAKAASKAGNSGSEPAGGNLYGVPAWGTDDAPDNVESYTTPGSIGGQPAEGEYGFALHQPSGKGVTTPAVGSSDNEHVYVPQPTPAAPAGVVLAEYAEGDGTATRISSAPLATDPLGLRAGVEGWINARVSRDVAEKALARGSYEPGAFCLRQGKASAESLVLSVLSTKGKVLHFRILEEGGKVKLGDMGASEESPEFDNVYALVAHFLDRPISAKVAHLTGCIPVGSLGGAAPSSLYALPSEDDDNPQLYATNV